MKKKKISLFEKMMKNEKFKQKYEHEKKFFEIEYQLEKIMEENAKLRECVEKVAYNYDRPADMMNSARQVLKELEGKK